ncbi:MAG TPA: hypothetical protein VGP08_16425 [Pyrinomonadaceae bacterium]|jgi:hypothetical protein|nr:hypothetical protein [Pyrinomonadaceae bacterium]
MIACDGNWDSQIRWTRKDGEVVDPSTKYESDGTLHVCPYKAAGAIHGTHIDVDSNYVEWTGGTSSLGDPDKERFTIAFSRTDFGGATYEYKGDGRVLNQGLGPAFIYGTVTVTSQGANNGDTGIWDAGRLRGPGRGPGPGEGGEAGTSQSGTHG